MGEPLISAQVLGLFHVSAGGRVIERADWQRPSAERLVKLLLVAEGHALPRDVAIETLWPDVDPDSGYNTFRKALHFARRALAVPGVLSSDRDNVRLDPTALDLDLDRLRVAFDQLSQTATPRRLSLAQRDHEPGGVTQADAVATVLELGGRPLLPDDAYEDWLVVPREQLLNRWQVVSMTAAGAAASDGRSGEAQAILQRILDRDPTDEAAHRLVIELYASEGRHHAARRQFELCRRALASLDLTPSAETEAAYQRAEVGAAASKAMPARARLVARDRELALVEPLFDRLEAGRSGALIIRGPAGIGKTRMLDEIREFGIGAGWRELSWQAIESNRPFAFAPFALRLSELVSAIDVDGWEEPQRSAVATILPGLGVRPHLEFAERSALVVALVAGLARIGRGYPLLLAIDDLPWLDEASIQVFTAMTSVFPDVPILLAVTYRDEEPVVPAAARLLDGMRRSGGLELRLGPLAERDIEPLVLAHLGGDSIAPDLAAWLFARSEGNPLFCLEVARDSAERGAIRLDNERWHPAGREAVREAPRAVRQLVATRIGSLGSAAATLLQTAAELGPIVGYDTLAAVLPDLDGGLIPALDSALASGLLVESAGGYAFAHPLFRAALVSEAGKAKRATLRLALARALAGATTADREEDLMALAKRCPDPGPAAEQALAAYELGLHEAGPLAVALGFAAGLRARRLFDREAATAFLGRSTTIWSGLPASTASGFDATIAFDNMAELHLAAGDEARAEAAFRAALGAARNAGELADAYEHFWWFPYRHGDFGGAISLCNEALTRLPAGSAAAAIIEIRLGWCLLHGLHQVDEALKLMERALPALEAPDQRPQLSFALAGISIGLAAAGRMADGLAALERSLALALELGDARLEMMARPHLAMLLNQAGRAAEARAHGKHSVALAEQMGDWYSAAVCAWLAADVEDALGNCEGAAELRRQELGLLARTGGNAHNEALAHAHLANLARRAADSRTELEEADRARKAAAQDPDPGYAAWIANAVTAERWSDVVAQEH